MIEFKRVDEVPPPEYQFKMTPETEELIGILNGMEQEETLHFPISGNDGKQAALVKKNMILGRLVTAKKHAEGYFKIKTRHNDIYVTKVE